MGGRLRAHGSWRIDIVPAAIVYVNLWLFAIAFGWIEASVVLYLREAYAASAFAANPGDFGGLRVTLISLPAHLLTQEVVREVCTIVLLGTTALIAGRGMADRIGAFLLTFGVWDVTYYAVLRLMSGWPVSLDTWDILFLIPGPWVAPVWTPLLIATLFAAVGSYLFWTADRSRRYGPIDLAVFVSAAALVVVCFMAESSAARENRTPQHFPMALFLAAVASGVLWFVRVERRAGRVQ